MKNALLTLIACWLGVGVVLAQTTITTNHINNNGNGSVTFNVQNTNAYDIIITDISCHLGTSAANNLQLLYNTTAVNDLAAPWSFGTVGNGQNGWILAGSGTVSSNTANGVVTAISGMSLTIPAGATYGLGFSATTLQYMTLTNGSGANVNTFAGGGVNLITGDGVSWGGTAYPSTPANYPRGFIGGITFIPAVPCTSPPTAGVVGASINPVCPSVNSTLSITGGTGGTGQTYQWQSSPDDVVYADIPGATMSTYIANQTAETYYRVIMTCGGLSDTSASFQLTLNNFTDCYCNSIPAFTADEEIYNVTVNGGSTDPLYANAAGCTTIAPGPGSILNRYSNFKTLAPITSVSTGQTVNFAIDQNECDGPTFYNNGIGVWIDFNQNGLFSDPGEAVFIEPSTAAGPRTVSGTFTVPVTAIPGNTAMRVICAEGYSGGSLTPCLTYNYGETEDFLINIQCPDLTGPSSIDVGVCTGSTATLTATPSDPLASISWWDAPAPGGTQLATTTSYTTPAILVNTPYYVQEDFPGCPSSIRDTVNVIVADVDVTLAPIDVTCNGFNNGSFTQTAVDCGTGPFTYSLDGGLTFGPIPTDLLAGTHMVIVQDATTAQSVPYQVIISEPGVPTALGVSDIGYFTATLSWTAEGDETDWTVIYGPAGFDPTTSGITINNATNPQIIYNLTENTDYEFYVAAGCSPTSAFAGPYAFATNTGFFTNDNACGPGFIDISGTGTALNLADDATTTVTSSFPLTVDGVSSNIITVSNNGWISWSGGSVYLNAWSLDLDDEFGNVYWQNVTVGGDNLFIVQWDDRPRFISVAGQQVTFQLIYNETTDEIYYIYDDVVFGGTQASNDYGLQGVINVDGPTTLITVSSYNNTYLTNNSCAHFYYSLCPNPINITAQPFQEEVFLNWAAGPYGEGEWTLIYGPAGFDPATSGTTITSSTPDAIIGGLTQLTDYDVYIYSECTLDSLTSGGALVSFTTLPWCADPTAINGSAAEDSLMVGWNWTESDPTYPVTSFNIQYGMAGFDLYTGTEVGADGIDFADTVDNPALMAGGVYDVYVQAVCGTDTSNYSGPITLVMPLTNDPACGAEALAVDGTEYTFNNGGATVDTGEAAIAPPADGAQVTTGWTNSSLNNTTWFTFVAPSSGSIRINNTAINYNGQAAVYAATDCGDFVTFSLIAANDNEIGGTSVAPNFTICGLTPGNTYYLMHDGFNGTTGNYGISISPINLNAGTANAITNVCAGDNIDLFSTASGEGPNGVWSSEIAAVNASINGADFESNGLAYQVFDFEYRITDGCAYDSVITQVEVYGPSSAGLDGTITACRNEPIDLLAGLNGTADLTGDWYNPSNQLMPGSDITTSNIPGFYNYDYIAGNGVCPDDTANVVLTVQNCNYLGMEEALFSGVKLFPNPSEGIVFITSDVNEAFDYTITDAKGSVIAKANGAIKNAQSNQIDLSNVETGVYFINLSNSQAQKVFRVVIQ